MLQGLPRRSAFKLSLTEHPEWAKTFWNNLIPLKDKIVNHPYFSAIRSKTIERTVGVNGLIAFYPLIEDFPKFMALNLAKTKRGVPGHFEAKKWLIQNIKVEQTHADWWHSWANGFGISDQELIEAKPHPLVAALNHYLWNINTYGSLIEGLAATNLAIEWATGEWTLGMTEIVRNYAMAEGSRYNERVLDWLKAHAVYDDEHPHEAMELIKRCAQTEAERAQGFAAASLSLQYYTIALDACYAQKNSGTADCQMATAAITAQPTP